MNTIKLVVIGGGSSYTPQLIEEIIQQYEVLPVAEIWLVDILEGRKRLSIVTNLAKRMVTRAGYPIKIIDTLDRRQAIKGATYIITQIRVGGLSMRQRDESICLKHGVIAQETTGAAGFMNALRTIPVMLDICEDIEELAPDAWLLNITNPCGIITEAIYKHTNIKVVGLSETPTHFYQTFAEMYQVPKKDINISFVGTNHLLWVTELFIKGKSKLTDMMLSDSTISEVNDKTNSLGLDPFFLQTYGAIPCNHHPYYLETEKILMKQKEAYKEGNLPSDGRTREETTLFSIYERKSTIELPKGLEDREGAACAEAAINVIKSIHYDQKQVHTVSVCNNGAIPCLPDDACIQVNSVVEQHRISPLNSEIILPHIRGLLQLIKAFEELTVEAAVTRNMGICLQALALHPLVPAEKAHALIQDLFMENEAYFHPVFY
ncbi:family 4 glycosyl hydrolase [Virgibacillus proomii]|jgi:6-phospho-beta-glucosidase|uniref:family 4 glycosyl hydrolase n=1 Tax=Virgibacillus proomii TaxID=84407 RepID=UPI0009853519|nr:6-phospho-beta-glucosidase [Virgibacillus proomii]